MSKSTTAVKQVENETGDIAVVNHNPVALSHADVMARFKTRPVTTPLLKFEDHDMQLAVQITGALRKGKEIPAKDGEPQQKPIDLVAVLNLQDGKNYDLVAASVIKSTLENEFPNGSYTGKYFAMRKTKGTAGKRYNNYEILELIPEE